MIQKKIAIIGLGGVGGYFGFKLNEALKGKGHEFTFLARNETYTVLNRDGLTLKSPKHKNKVTRPNRILESITDLKQPDLVLICVKSYDLKMVCEALSPIIKEDTVIIPLMNGADIYSRIRKIIKTGIVLPSCVYLAAHIETKGIIAHKGKPGKIIFGSDPKNITFSVDWIIKLFKESKIDHTYSNHPQIEIWSKFIFVASFGLVTAKYNLPIGAVCEMPELRSLATAIMTEIKSITFKKSISIPNTIITSIFEKAATFPYHNPTSLQLDIHNGKKQNELALFAGTIMELGKKHQINTPYTTQVYKDIQALI